jgi:hypothetical protein
MGPLQVCSHAISNAKQHRFEINPTSTSGISEATRSTQDHRSYKTTARYSSFPRASRNFPKMTTLLKNSDRRNSGDIEEKAHVDMVENTLDPEGASINEKELISPGADYSGFVQKTDPREIKLVRKLDIYIMTSLWSMYWLN